MLTNMMFYSPQIDAESKDIEQAEHPIKVRALRARQVRAFLDSSLFETTAFSRPDIMRTLLIAFDRRLLALGMYRGDLLEGVALLLVQRKGPLGIVQRLPIRYAGLIADPLSMPGHLRCLMPHLAALGIGKAFYSFSPWARPDPVQLESLGYIVDEASTMILPIDKDNVVSVAERRVRESVRAAARQGVKVRAATQREMRELLPGFLEQTYGRRQIKSPYPPGAAGIIWDRHHDDPRTRLATALQGDTALGMMVTILHKDRAYSWIVARDYTKAEHLNVNAMLVYDAAEWAGEQHATELDLGGGTPGIKEFKRRLGAVELPYSEVHGTHPLYAPVFGVWNAIKARM